MATEGRRLLESWKEIAAYLKRSEKTCRRFEETFGLPVHRLDGTPKARVFAYTDELDQWLLAKLNHTQEEAQEAAEEEAAKRARAVARVRKRKRLALLIGVGGAAVLAVAAGLLWRRLSPAPGPLLPRNPSLAVLPFDNPAKDPGLEPWRTALADLVITDLVQSRYVNVVPITEIVRKLVGLKLGETESFTDEALKTFAEKARIDFIASGKLFRERGSVFVTVDVRDPRTGELPRAVRIGYKEESEVFSAADRITKQIKLALGLKRRHIFRDIDRGVAGISTESPQAFLLYSQGYRLAAVLKHIESVALLQRAVEIDPEFALAYRNLYRAHLMLGRTDEAKKNIEHALHLPARLSARERGELELAFSREYAKDPAAERAALLRIHRDYPQDRRTSRELLRYYFELEDWDNAFAVAAGAWPANTDDPEICQQLAKCYLNFGLGGQALAILDEFDPTALGPSGPTAARAIALTKVRCLRNMGRYDESLDEIDRLLAQFPNEPDLILAKGTIQLHRKDFPAARREFERVIGQNDPWYQFDAMAYMRDMLLMQGRVDEAKAELRKALALAASLTGERARRLRPRLASVHFEMSYLHQLAGDLEEALKEIDETLQAMEPSPSQPPINILGQKAIILLDMDRTEDFAKLTEEIKGHIERRDRPKLMRIYHYLLGRAELKRGEPKKAVGHLWRAADLLSVPGRDLDSAEPGYFYYLAEAMRRGRGAGSSMMYEKVTLPAVNCLHNGDIYAMSLYWLAKSSDSRAEGALLAQTSRTELARAAGYYREFLALWGGADPLFAPQVEDARMRLAALEKHLASQ